MEQRLSDNPALVRPRRLLAIGEIHWRGPAQVVFFLWLTYVVAVGQPNLGPRVFGPTITLHVLVGAMAALFLLQVAVQRRLPGPTHLDWLAAGTIAAYGAATALSVAPRLSAEASLLAGAGIILFYAVHDSRFLTVDSLVRSLAGVVALLALLGVVSFVRLYVNWLNVVEAVEGSVGWSSLIPPTFPRAKGMLDHPNILAMLLNLALPFALVLAIRPRASLDRALGGFALLAGVMALILTFSRGGWVAAVAWVAVFWLVYVQPRALLQALRHSAESIRRRAALVAVGAALAGVLFAVVVVTFRDALPIARLGVTFSLRFDAAWTAVGIIEDRPAFGAGPYTYGLVYEDYDGAHPGASIHPHNLYLRVLSDVGFAGGAVLLAGAIVVAYTLGRGLRNASPSSRLYLAACAAAFSGLLVHGLVDSPSAWNTVLLPLALIVALTMRLSPPPAPRAGAIGRAPRVLAMLLLPVTLAGWIYFDRAHSRYDESLRYLSTGQSVAAAASAVEAADADGDFAPYQLHAGVMLAQLYVEGLERGDNPDAMLLSRSVSSLRRAIALEPNNAQAEANLALALQLTGDMPGAADAARRATATAPHDGAAASIAGNVLEWAGLPGEAASAYARAVKANPELAQSPYWASTPARLAMRPAVLDLSGVKVCELAWMAAIYAQYVDDLDALAGACREKVAESPASGRQRAELAVALKALGIEDEARVEASQALRLASREPRARIASALVLASDSHIANVRHALLVASGMGSQDATVFLAYTYGDTGSSSPLALIPSQPGEMPDLMVSRLNRVARASATTVDQAAQIDPLGRNHYRIEALREAPYVIFIPGEWSTFASPRAGLLIDALAPYR